MHAGSRQSSHFKLASVVALAFVRPAIASASCSNGDWNMGQCGGAAADAQLKVAGNLVVAAPFAGMPLQARLPSAVCNRFA